MPFFFAAMPGKHSPAKLLARRLRARDRGFLRPLPDDRQHIEVSRDLAPRAKAVTTSLELHRMHNQLSGSAVPVARSATRRAKPLLSDDEYRRAMAAHDKANLAKHKWEPDDSGSVVSSPPACGAAPSDAVVLPTPTCGASSLPPSSPPLCGDRPPDTVDTGAQTGGALLCADAPEFVPDAYSRPSYAEGLFDVQNATIALLTGSLDKLLPSQRKLRELERKVESLRSSLSDAIDRKLSLAIDAKLQMIDDKLQAHAKQQQDSTERILMDLSENIKKCILSGIVKDTQAAERRLLDRPESTEKSLLKFSSTHTAAHLPVAVPFVPPPLGLDGCSPDDDDFFDANEYIAADEHAAGGEDHTGDGHGAGDHGHGGDELAAGGEDHAGGGHGAGNLGHGGDDTIDCKMPPPAVTDDVDAIDLYEPVPGDVVRLSGLSSARYNDRVAKVVSRDDTAGRVPVQLLPNGPSIRVLRQRLSFPALCRMCGERIHGVACGACYTPADFVAPDDSLPEFEAFPPPSSGARTHVTSAPPRHPRSDRTVSAKPSEAELARRLAAAQWT